MSKKPYQRIIIKENFERAWETSDIFCPSCGKQKVWVAVDSSIQCACKACGEYFSINSMIENEKNMPPMDQFPE